MQKRKGILLAGGSGTRLYPLTKGVSKQLMAVYDKPLIYYPLSVLMLADIREVLVITTPYDQDQYRKLLGDGSQFGIEISYAPQLRPEGIAQAFIIGADFLRDSPVALILGDNIFHGEGLRERIMAASAKTECATIFGYQVVDPERFGVVEMDTSGRARSIVEKPKIPKSDLAVTGLYFYDSSAVEVASTLKPSARGEYEITDLNMHYLSENKLFVDVLGTGFAWLDTGTHDSLLDAANYIATLERRQGHKVACLEEIAWRNGWLDDTALELAASPIAKSNYGQYLLKILNRKRNPV